MFWAENLPENYRGENFTHRGPILPCTINLLPQYFCYTLDKNECLPNRFGDVQIEKTSMQAMM